MKKNNHLSFILTSLLAFSFLFAAETNIGDTVTFFSANDENGNLWSLNDNLTQKYLIVYFYPAALTGG